MVRAALFLCAVLALAGCGGGDEVRPYAVVRRPDIWQNIIQESDRPRLAGLYSAWAAIRRDVPPADLAALGAVVSDTAVRAGGFPGAGTYRCRMVRLGRRRDAPAGQPLVQVGDWQACTLRADGTMMRLVGSGDGQTLSGTLFTDNDRLVFLGTVRLPGEMGVLPYGTDRDRSQVGALQTVGEAHWRIALPWPRWQSKLNILELVPA
ncbi:DUF4893 domain-containing protein [Sandarakinorhabdus sp.]|uniref:DUF4893 domain-containing protein n=1 Tax=Sandarakinorhabdus sp. TaxID=1916663 RepID=UPI00286E8725|nr:DUF4893 domain-containing protein [Sandarakinorhabdus sp.]